MSETTATVEIVSHQSAIPPHWEVLRHLDGQTYRWTFLTMPEANDWADRARAWPDDHRPESWAMQHMYDYDAIHGR